VSGANRFTGAAVDTSAVIAEAAVADSFARFRAVTLTRMPLPASPATGVYVDLMAPPMSAQVAASVRSVHACHW
jgi:hypothetical protein